MKSRKRAYIQEVDDLTQLVDGFLRAMAGPSAEENRFTWPVFRFLSELFYASLMECDGRMGATDHWQESRRHLVANLELGFRSRPVSYYLLAEASRWVHVSESVQVFVRKDIRRLQRINRFRARLN